MEVKWNKFFISLHHLHYKYKDLIDALKPLLPNFDALSPDIHSKVFPFFKDIPEGLMDLEEAAITNLQLLRDALQKLNIPKVSEG